jgi:glyoxylase-like metal-dependent hydrolase (beta-lactamase superfamily II)
MKKIVLIIGLVVLLGAAYVIYQFRGIQQFEVTELTPDLYMISGDFGGNVAALRTGAGSVVVDTMTFTVQGERIRELAEDLTGEPVVMIINSHYHLDHTHGNPGFEVGTRVVSTTRTLEHLRELDADHFSGAAADLLPGETFDGEHRLEIGDKTLQLLHPGRGHTDGDLVVLFVEDRALHTGDLFFNRHYPNIDLEAGGSIAAWGDTLETLFALPFEQVIPGHGAVSDPAGLRQFQVFVRELAEVGLYAASINGSLTDTLVNGQLTSDAGYQPVTFGPVTILDREFVIQRSWEEATGNFQPYPHVAP